MLQLLLGICEVNKHLQAVKPKVEMFAKITHLEFLYKSDQLFGNIAEIIVSIYNLYKKNLI